MRKPSPYSSRITSSAKGPGGIYNPPPLPPPPVPIRPTPSTDTFMTPTNMMLIGGAIVILYFATQ